MAKHYKERDRMREVWPLTSYKIVCGAKKSVFADVKVSK
jgi:hypothetical protein